MHVNHPRLAAFENSEKPPNAGTRIPGGIMDLATQTHLTTLRHWLNYRLVELRAEVHAAQLARLESDVDAHEVADRKGEATQQQLEGLGGAQEQRDIDELAQVESALKRLDAGTYGNCADCGDPIPLQRLQVQPAAQCCATCQAAHERAQTRSR
jgi:DnaK suppressor protein